MGKIALIDGDIVAYRCSAVCEKDDAPLARWQADELVKRILSDIGASDYQMFLSGDNNFRYSIFPGYKAKRKLKPRPRHLEYVKEHLVLEWGASITDGIEADDALGIANHKQPNRVICSIDKDLLQLEGLHYNFVRRDFIEVGAFEGWKNFYTQLLVGDSTDDIPGCRGIGAAKAPRVLELARTDREMYLACAEAYNKASGTMEEMHRNAQLLFVLREEGVYWNPPVGNDSQEPEQDHKSDSLTPSEVMFTEPTGEQMTSGIQPGGTKTTDATTRN